jgi:peptide/nickel transport system substrate-binding protein
MSRFSDPVVDDLLERADRQLVPGERLLLLQEAQRRALEALPVLPLTIRWGFLGASSRVEVQARHDETIWLYDYRWRT